MDALEKYFQKLESESKKAGDLDILFFNYSQISQGLETRFLHDLQKMQQKIQSSPKLKTVIGLLKFELPDDQGDIITICIYAYVIRKTTGKDKFEIGVFMNRTLVNQDIIEGLSHIIKTLNDDQFSSV